MINAALSPWEMEMMEAMKAKKSMAVVNSSAKASKDGVDGNSTKKKMGGGGQHQSAKDKPIRSTCVHLCICERGFSRETGAFMRMLASDRDACWSFACCEQTVPGPIFMCPNRFFLQPILALVPRAPLMRFQVRWPQKMCVSSSEPSHGWCSTL